MRGREQGPLLCVCASFPPETTPTAIRSHKLLSRLAASARITVLTATPQAQAASAGMEVRRLSRRTAERVTRRLERWRLVRLIELFAWPDTYMIWSLRAVVTGLKLVSERRPSAILAFTMPYSAGLAALALGRITKLPVIVALDDSPTCTDMHEHHPTRLHSWANERLEDLFVRSATRTVYTSKRNLERVARRHDPVIRRRLALIRYGADPVDFGGPQPPSDPDHVRIVYIGGATGWYELLSDHQRPTVLQRARRRLDRLGRHEVARLDHRTSSPVYLGRAIAALVARRPEWKGRITLDWIGDVYPREVRDAVLAHEGLLEHVSTSGPVPHAEAIRRARSADLLFIAMPKRLTGCPGGRISAKTYEYLMTDRPILAAVPPGENRDYLLERDGVWVVEPDDTAAMARVLEKVAESKLSGRPIRSVRPQSSAELGYDGRAAELEQLLEGLSKG